jgi:hypothetical protein
MIYSVAKKGQKIAALSTEQKLKNFRYPTLAYPPKKSSS